MSETTMSIAAIVIGVLAIGASAIQRRWNQSHNKAQVVSRMNGAEIGRQDMTLRQWHTTRKMTGKPLSDFVQPYGVQL